MSPKRTMAVAQQLYEGVELGSEGPTGLITYMRTDSTRVADTALDELRAFIGKQYGPEYLPKSVNQYKNKKGSQDAHEAIRPTSVTFEPDGIKSYLSRDQYRLYRLIWERFVASQMVPAVYDATAFDIECDKYLMRATGQVMKFPGFTRVYIERLEEANARNEKTQRRFQRGPARSRRGRNRQAAEHRSEAELHPAAAALLRGHAGQGTGGSRHRTALHLRLDSVHHSGQEIRAQVGRTPVLPMNWGRW